MTEKLRMNAYYYSFDKTGVLAIDKILSEIAVAGKKYHHTADWSANDDLGETCEEAIQRVANEAAAEFRKFEAT